MSEDMFYATDSYWWFLMDTEQKIMHLDLCRKDGLSDRHIALILKIYGEGL